jgi:imidazolonepropionase-like amidohydrolase
MAIVLSGARLIDGRGGPPVLNSVVVLDGNAITWVGDAPDLKKEGPLDLLERAQSFDLRDKTLLPGLINAHEHLTWRRTVGSWTQRVLQQRPEDLLLRGMGQALVSLAEGVTSVRDMGSKDGMAIRLKRAIESGILIGPRMVVAGRPLAMTGGHGGEVNCFADGPDEVRKAAREQLQAGADLVKVMASGGFVSRGTDLPTSLQLSLEEMHTAFEEADKAGKRTAAHAHAPIAIRTALEAGADSIEHGGFLDEETAALMAERGVFLVPTLCGLKMSVELGVQMGRPGWLIEAAREMIPQHFGAFRNALEAGVKIAAGVDSLGDLQTELEFMVEGGMSPMDALLSATRDAAECLGLETQVGTVEPGKMADLIVVNGDPSKNINALRHVELVIKDGVVYKPEDLQHCIGPSLQWSLERG